MSLALNLEALLKSTSTVREAQYPNAQIGAIDTKYNKQNKSLGFYAQARPYTDSLRKTPYKVSLLFYGINSYDEIGNRKLLTFADSRRNKYYLDPPTEKSRILLRCQCKDFRFMWSYYDKKHKSLLGPLIPYTRKTTTYPPRNPLQMPGLCKHQIALLKMLIHHKAVVFNNQGLITYLDRKKPL